MSERAPTPRKKEPDPPEEGGADFMMLFTALMIILLAFFILLTTMASPDDSKRRVALGSLYGSFGILPGGLNLDTEGDEFSKVDQISEGSVVFRKLVRELEVMLSNQGMVDAANETELDESGMYPRLVVSSQVLYQEGDTEIAPKAFPILDKIAAAAEESGSTLEIEGHTSARPPPKSARFPSNWELSAQRAVNIQRYFVEATRMAPQNVVAHGLAQYRPNGKPRDRIVIVFKQGTISSKR